MAKAKIVDYKPNNWKDLKPHPYAGIVRMQNAQEFNGLTKSMEENGYDPEQRIIIYDGQILDGRNRHKAAIKAGKVPTFGLFEGEAEGALIYVAMHNIEGRRNLTSADRARAGAIYARQLMNLREAEDEPETPADDGKKKTKGKGKGKKKAARGRAVEKAAKASGAAPAQVSRRLAVENKGVDELVRAVDDEVIPLVQAAKIAQLPPAEQRKKIQEVEEKGRVIRDADGVIVPHVLKPAFSDQDLWEKLKYVADQGTKVLRELNKRPSGKPHIPTSMIGSLVDLAHFAEQYKPARVCPHCEGKKEVDGVDCPCCNFGKESPGYLIAKQGQPAAKWYKKPEPKDGGMSDAANDAAAAKEAAAES